MLALTAIAGCITDEENEKPGLGDDLPLDSDELPLDAARPYINPVILAEEGHDHEAPDQHDISNYMELVGFHPLGDDGPPGAISEIDVAGGYAFLGIMGYGFQVVDITNKTAPELVASVEVHAPEQLAADRVYLADLKTDDSGDWVFVATELSASPGVLIYDARDKSDITLAGFWPEPGLLLGCHMVEYAIIGESEYLFCAPLDNAIYVGQLLPPVDTAAGAVREVVQVARWMPTTPKFVQQQGNAASGYVTDCAAGNTGACASAALHFFSGHQDMTHQVDPLTGKDMLSVSFWNLGLRFVDVSNPLQPAEVGSWQGEDSEKWDGVLHTSMMFESNGSRIAATIPEGGDPPALFILDATDLDNPKILAEWTARDDFHNESSRFSMHNFQIVDGLLYLAMYHGGIWVFDISTPALQAEPKVLGTYMPWHRDTGRGCCGGIMAWDVVVHEGYILTANAGFYVLKLEGATVGEEAPSSFA